MGDGEVCWSGYEHNYPVGVTSCCHIQIAVGVNPQVPGELPGISEDDRLWDIVRECIDVVGYYGGVNMLEKCWALGMIQ